MKVADNNIYLGPNEGCRVFNDESKNLLDLVAENVRLRDQNAELEEEVALLHKRCRESEDSRAEMWLRLDMFVKNVNAVMEEMK